MNILVFWESMPICGIRINTITKSHNVIVFATDAPINNNEIDKFISTPVIRIKNNWVMLFNSITWKKHDIFILTGWSNLIINLIAVYQKLKGAKILMTVDNIENKTIKQTIGRYIFKIILKRFYDGVLIPGRKSRLLMQKFGFDKKKLTFGYYGASSRIFKPLSIRKNNFPKKFIFVGSLNKRKGFDILIKSYRSYKNNGGKWGLVIIGFGESDFLQKLNLGNIDGLLLKGNLNPEQINYEFSKASCFVIASRHDNWATVLCEASMAGLCLLGSKYAGASYDLIKPNKNGYIFDPYDNSLLDYFNTIENKSLDWFKQASEYSIKLSKNKFDEEEYSRGIERFL